MWSRDRVAAGWVWGPKRDDRKKHHPALLAYGKLSDADKQWDRASAAQTLAVIHALDFEISGSAVVSGLSAPPENNRTQRHKRRSLTADGIIEVGSRLLVPEVVSDERGFNTCPAAAIVVSVCVSALFGQHNVLCMMLDALFLGREWIRIINNKCERQ